MQPLRETPLYFLICSMSCFKQGDQYFYRLGKVQMKKGIKNEKQRQQNM